MAKMITAKELAEIITRQAEVKLLLTSDEIDDADAFLSMMSDMAETVTTYCGGEVLNGASADGGVCMIGIHPNDSLPEDGGIWKDYDTDESFATLPSRQGKLLR